MSKYKHYDVSGCYSLLGLIINSAIRDYQSIDPKGMHHTAYKSAKHYLFSPNGLEVVINKIGLDLDIKAIRYHASQV